MLLLDNAQFMVFAQHIAKMKSGQIAIDLETTGLSPYHGARAFLIGVSECDFGEHSCFLTEESREAVALLCSNKNLRYGAHGAKFEIGFLKTQFGVDVAGPIWDTEDMERIVYNNHLRYSLQHCAERIGLSKHVPMLEWVKVHGPKYHEAPEELIIPYVEQDAKLSRILMENQISQFKHWDTATGVPIKGVVSLATKVIKPLAAMEHRGLKLDLNYAKEALEYEHSRQSKIADDWKQLTGQPLVDSRKSLTPIFTANGITFGQTDKGNASFSHDALAGSKEHPIVKLLFDHRDAAKRASTYWENFIALVDENGFIHPRIMSSEAKTSRMSVRDPACQTWPDDGDDVKFPIRKAFIPTHQDCVIVSIDWKMMELVLMADEAGDTQMIADIRSGADMHQRIADAANVPRSLAKNGRFAKQYGAGPPRIAQTLGVTLEVAQRICREIDLANPRTSEYSRELIRYAQRHHMGYNWLGRRYFFDKGFEFKYPNYRIQGGCGEILRIAIIDIDKFLAENAREPTRILLPIHDELLLNWHKQDLHLIPQVKALMIAAYRSKKNLAMDATVTTGPNFFEQEAYAG